MRLRSRHLRVAVHLLVLAFVVGLWIVYGQKVGAAAFVAACLGYLLGYAEGLFAAVDIMDDE